MKSNLLRIFARPDVQKRGVIIAVIVGTILNCINQGTDVLAGELIVWTKAGLTYLVPYFVSTYSSVSTIARSNDSSQSPSE